MLITIATALAAWPDDISLTALGAGDAEAIDPEANQLDYELVVRELGVAIANKPLYGADTLGVSGMEFGLTNTIAFTSAAGDDISDVTAWDRMTEGGDPNRVTVIPTLSVRKGLPLSTEIGVNAGWVAFTRQSTLGVYGRIAPIEGYKNAPDLALQVGYAGYLANDELELGAMDWSGIISYSLPFGTLVGINHAVFTPWAGAGQVILHAQPRISDAEQARLGVAPVSGFKDSEYYDAEDPWRFTAVHAGFRIVNRGFHFRVGTSWYPAAEPTLNSGVGFTF